MNTNYIDLDTSEISMFRSTLIPIHDELLAHKLLHSNLINTKTYNISSFLNLSNFLQKINFF